MTIFKMVILVNGEEKVYFPKSEEVRNRNIEAAKAKGYKVIKNKKLYPIGNFNKYQHVFYNEVDRAWNRIYDIEEGKSNEDMDEAYEWLEKCQEAQGKFDFGPQDVNGVVYVEYEDYKFMKDVIGGYAYRHGGIV